MYNGYYYGFDMTYLVLVVPALLIALIAQIQVKSAFSRYACVRCTSGLYSSQKILYSKLRTEFINIHAK